LLWRGSPPHLRVLPRVTPCTARQLSLSSLGCCAIFCESVMPGGCTQKSGSLIFCLLFLCGCTHPQYASLKTLANGLEQPWPGSHSASMTMTVLESEGHTVLHCRLQNLSWKLLVVDRSRLPWNTPIFLYRHRPDAFDLAMRGVRTFQSQHEDYSRHIVLGTCRGCGCQRSTDGDAQKWVDRIVAATDRSQRETRRGCFP